MVQKISAAEFDTVVLKNAKPVLVDFYADWCGPCRMTAPFMEKLSNETDAVVFVKINVDEDPAPAMQYGVESIPNLIVFKNGAPAAQAIGMQNLEGLKALIAKAL